MKQVVDDACGGPLVTPKQVFLEVPNYFQNEITFLDSLATAGIVTTPSKNDWNRVMKKGEKPITSLDEVKFIHAPSLTARLKSPATKDKD